MADTKQTESASTQEPRTPGLDCCCCDPEALSRIMEDCRDEKGAFDCRAMMQRICGGGSKEPGKQP